MKSRVPHVDTRSRTSGRRHFHRVGHVPAAERHRRVSEAIHRVEGSGAWPRRRSLSTKVNGHLVSPMAPFAAPQQPARPDLPMVDDAASSRAVAYCPIRSLRASDATNNMPAQCGQSRDSQRRPDQIGMQVVADDAAGTDHGEVEPTLALVRWVRSGFRSYRGNHGPTRSLVRLISPVPESCSIPHEGAVDTELVGEGLLAQSRLVLSTWKNRYVLGTWLVPPWPAGPELDGQAEPSTAAARAIPGWFSETRGDSLLEITSGWQVGASPRDRDRGAGDAAGHRGQDLLRGRREQLRPGIGSAEQASVQ